MNPNTNGMMNVINLLAESFSSVNVKIAYTIIVNDGGTNRVEINRASLCGVNKFNNLVSNYSLIKLNILNCYTERNLPTRRQVQV